MNQPRWLIQLVGDSDTVEDLPRLFPDGPVHVVREEENYYLTGSAFEVCDDHAQVRELAEGETDLLTAAAKLLVGRFARPKLTAIYRIDEQGNKHAFVPGVVVDQELRWKVLGPDGCDIRPTTPQRHVSAARSSPHLQLAMQLWAEETRTWPRLYRVLEEIEQSFGGIQVDRLGFCSSNERERFARSANSPKVSGLDARHADRGHVPPTNSMSLTHAIQFLRSLLIRALDDSAPKQSDA
jgi:hypothetical protein